MRTKEQKQILLILDLDETLIHATRELLDRPADLKLGPYQVYRRPGLEAFLKFAAQHFLLAIWSSASDAYVQEIVDNITPSGIHYEFIWGRSRCTQRRNLQLDDRGYYDDDAHAHYHYVKPLKKVKRLGYNLDRTLIIDDSPHKAQDNYGNAIYPRPYYGSASDNELSLLAQYLERLANKDNLRRLEKRNWRSNTIRKLK